MIGAIAIGLAGGVVAGMLGVGGGVLFVPGLVLFLGLSQHEAEATSLLAIVPVALAGTISQERYGNVRRADAAVMGVLSMAGAVAGVALANALSGEALRLIFAALILFVAARLLRSTLHEMAAERETRSGSPHGPAGEESGADAGEAAGLPKDGRSTGQSA